MCKRRMSNCDVAKFKAGNGNAKWERAGREAKNASPPFKSSFVYFPSNKYDLKYDYT